MKSRLGEVWELGGDVTLVVVRDPLGVKEDSCVHACLVLSSRGGSQRLYKVGSLVPQNENEKWEWGSLAMPGRRRIA